jgi:hypothetical protein
MDMGEQHHGLLQFRLWVQYTLVTLHTVNTLFLRQRSLKLQTLELIQKDLYILIALPAHLLSLRLDLTLLLYNPHLLLKYHPSLSQKLLQEYSQVSRDLRTW